MTKMQAYKYLQDHGAGFIANVVLCQHKNPARKLRAMATLVQRGHVVTLGSFSIDTLVIDGASVPWSSLEHIANRLGQHSERRMLELENRNLRAALAAPCETCEDREIAEDIDANS